MDHPGATSTDSAAPAETASGAMDHPVTVANDSAAPAETPSGAMDDPVAIAIDSAAPAETTSGAMDDPVATANDSAAPAEITPKTRRPQLASRVGKDGKSKVPWRARADIAQPPRMGPNLGAKIKKWQQKLARVKGAYPKKVAQQAWAENQPASTPKYRKEEHINATIEVKRVEDKKKKSKSQVVKNMGKGRGRSGKKTRQAITRAYMHTHKNEALRVCKLLAKLNGYERNLLCYITSQPS